MFCIVTAVREKKKIRKPAAVEKVGMQWKCYAESCVSVDHSLEAFALFNIVRHVAVNGRSKAREQS
jgi:hypothetical protein